jgi:chemotaxis protein methyltransferase CheR
MAMDYEAFKDYVFKLSSIDLNAYKERQMKRRIDSLIRKNGYSGYDDYMVALKEDAKVYEEFINYLTINVSEFYRNPAQWEVLRAEVIPYLQKEFNKNIKIWSAACSTGDEPYSLAMVLSEFMPLTQISIVATDIDDQILSKAKIGLYNEKSLAGLPEHFKKKFFTEVGKSFKISDDIKKCITFKKHNLLRDQYPKGMDLIVCRNVLIYFTEEAKNDIYTKFNQSLNQSGILFVGSTEQIIQSQKYQFEPIRSFFYRKIDKL